MTLEEFTAELNQTTFWKEFSFSRTRFYPRAKSEVELADGIVTIGPLALVFQLKERTEPTGDPEAERKWFRAKVLRKAMDQIKDSLRYLAENEEIRLTNDRGHEIGVRGADLENIKKVVIYVGAPAMPQDCWETKFYLSSTAGFVHIIAAHDYLSILNLLRVPEDVRQYLDYREKVLPHLSNKGLVVEEPDIVVGFMSEAGLPEPNSLRKLAAFRHDFEAFDLSKIMHGLSNHIVASGDDESYYRILEEFARVPRSVWREFKVRLTHFLGAAKKKEWKPASRFAFPKTDCTFMVTNLDPDCPATGVESERLRVNAVKMHTEAAKYDLKTTIGVGLLISMDGEFVQLDWCLVDRPWEPDPAMDELLAIPLFGPAREKIIGSFLVDESYASSR